MQNGDLKQIRGWLKSVSDNVKKLDDKVDNHLVTIAKDITEVKTNVAWLKKFFWIFITPAIGAAIIAFISVIIK